MKKRIPYIAAFIIIVTIEVLIALFIDDNFIRPYMGDVIVVWAVYSFVQIILGGRYNAYAVSTGVFVFACLVEILQGINIVKLLGLQESRFFSVLIGTHFDIKDIICYACGTILLIGSIAINHILNSRRRNT